MSHVIPTINNIATEQFDTWDAFVSFIEAPLPKQCLPWIAAAIGDDPERVQAERRDKYAWRGNATWSDVIRMCYEGYWDVEDQVAHAAAPIISRITSLVERPDPYHELVGHEIDIARYCEGEPECWLDVHRPIIDGFGNRIVRIGVNAFYSAGFSDDQILARGVVICAIIECLEMAGIRCEVTSVLTGGEKYDLNETSISDIRICLKEAGQPLDMGRLCFVLCHPSWFRIVGFDLWDHCEAAEQRRVGAHRCSPIENPEHIKQDFDIWFGGMSLFNQIYHDKKKLENYLVNTLREQGIEIDYETGEGFEQVGIWDTIKTDPTSNSEDQATRDARERMWQMEYDRKLAERARLEEQYRLRRAARRGRTISRRRMKLLDENI